MRTVPSAALAGTFTILMLLAGCVTPADLDADVARESVLEAPPARVTLADCTQTHAFFTLPAAAFAGRLPDGFTPAPADDAGATTQFLLATSACASATLPDAAGVDAFGEMWGFLFVTPPDGATDGYLGDVWPLGAFVTHDRALPALAALGFPAHLVTIADVAITSVDAGAAVISDSSVVSSTESYAVRGIVASSDADYHPGAFRVWIPDDGNGVRDVTMDYAWEDGTEIGLGGTSHTYSGDLLEQPGVNAGLLHHVQGVHAWWAQSGAAASRVSEDA